LGRNVLDLQSLVTTDFFIELKLVQDTFLTKGARVSDHAVDLLPLSYGKGVEVKVELLCEVKLLLFGPD
jgi:hypothetical protein